VLVVGSRRFGQAEQVEGDTGVDPSRKLADEVHVPARDIEVILVTGSVRELVEVLRVDDSADRQLWGRGGSRGWVRSRRALPGERMGSRGGGHYGYPERPAQRKRHEWSPLF